MNLIKKAKNGSSDVFIQLIEENITSLYKVAKSYLKNDEDIANVISETVLIAYEKLYQLKNDRYLKTWLIRILINQCKQMYEKNKKYELTDKVIETGEDDSNYSNIEFDELLSEFPEKDRVLFILRYSEGYTTKQIADMLDMNENTVVSRKFNETYSAIKNIEKQNNKESSHLMFLDGLKIVAAVIGVVILVGAGTVAASNGVWSSAVERIFGNLNKKSTKAEMTKNESIPEITYISVDEKMAEKYIAGYIQTEKIEKNIGEYKLTLESYVTDGNIVDASMILESKKELSGIMDGNDKENADKGMSYAQNTPFTFEIIGDKGKGTEKMYIDTKKSTKYKYYITYYGI